MSKRTVSQPKKEPRSPQRIPSGVNRLDYILGGGFIVGGTYNLKGPPGSGKTILANQTCFSHAKNNGGKCVYVTLLAETHSKMIMHLETLSFFDPKYISDGRITFISAYSILRKEGLDAVLSLIRKTTKRTHATFLVLDGVQVAEETARSSPKFSEFLHELQAYVSILGCTTLLLTPLKRGVLNDPGSVIADGVIELSYHLVGPRSVREIMVHKFRGTNYLLGKHEVEIKQDGLQVHPRIEVQFNVPPEHAEEQRLRMQFGIRRLDQMLHGGLLSGTATTLLGAPGTGKTLFGLAFLVEGAKRGQPGVYFGFYEPPPRLIAKAARVGIALQQYVEKKLIKLIWQPPLEHFMDSLAEQLLQEAHLVMHASLKGRLFIDSMEGFRAATVYPDRLPRFISALANQLRMADITTLIAEELSLFKAEVHLPHPQLAAVTEGVILVRYVEVRSQIHRLISVMKMRESQYDTSIRQFKITDQGIVVSRSFLTAESVLSGRGRLMHGQLDVGAYAPSRTHKKKPAPRPSVSSKSHKKLPPNEGQA